jgi:hypothetical protein
MMTTSTLTGPGTKTITVARVGATLVSLGTFAFLFVSDGWQSDNLFLVPDLILCAGLVVATLLRGPTAVPALILTLGLAAGVLATSVSSSAVDGELSVPSLMAAVSAAALALLLIHNRAGVRKLNG